MIPRSAVSIVVCAFLAQGLSRAAERGELNSNPSLFAVLAALNAVGYDAELESPSNHPVRKQVREYIQQKNPPVLAELKQFYATHRTGDANIDLSNYISLALVLQGPPNFKTVTHLKELPPDAVVLEAMSPLLERFWREADLDTLWKRLEPVHDQLIERFHGPVTQELLRANAYLRNPTSGYLGRRFLVYIDIMGAPNQVQTRSYGDDYFVVSTMSAEPPVEDIRHAYLFYLLDPLSLKYSKDIDKKKDLKAFAQAPPALASFYKDDFFLLTTASLVKAVTAKLAPSVGGNRLAKVDLAFREGFILTPFFYENLAAYEKQDRSMKLYYPEMIQAIDLKKEDQRLTNVEWAPARSQRKVQTVAERPPQLTGAARTLDEAENLYNEKQYPKAKELYSKSLSETDSRPLHAKAYFGLARISAVNREFEMSEKLFQKTLELNPESEIKAWAHVFLGRLAFTGGAAEEASQHYKDALGVDGAPLAAKRAAEKGLADAIQKK